MTPQLQFDEIPDRVVMSRPDAFRRYADRGHYLLPNIVINTPVGAEAVIESLRVHNVDGVQGDLAHWFAHRWAPEPGGPVLVSGSTVVRTDVTVPDLIVRQSMPDVEPTRRRRGQAVVTWTMVARDSRDPRAAATSVSLPVVLDFAPLGAKPDERMTWSMPTLRSRGTARLGTFAAVDFGTSSSTVALYGVRDRNLVDLDPAQAACLGNALADLVQDTSHGEWPGHMTRLTEKLAERLPDLALSTPDSLAHVLRSGAIRPDLLDELCEELEKILADAQPPLSTWLSDQLHTGYDDAFRVPALESQRLLPVVLDEPSRRIDIATTVAVTADNPLVVNFHDTGRPQSDATRVFHDLKQRFATRDREPIPGLYNGDGSAVRIDHLVAWVYHLLVGKTEAFAHGDSEGERRSLGNVVATYPTTTTPFTRARLSKVIKDSLDVLVSTDYDEGVASALYFLMRDFGGAKSLGVEALRAGSVRLPTWRQTMLVIDIGGGTTDIAFVALNLTDRTRDLPDIEDSVTGRFYRIEPEVLGSTGDRFLGGDYLTLRVFYWLKAEIIDQMVSGESDEPARRRLIAALPARFRPGATPRSTLADAVLSNKSDEPAPSQVARLLRTVLNTGFEPGNAAGGAAFWQLWKEAERAKVALGQNGNLPYTVDRADLEEFLAKVGNLDESYTRLLSDRIELTADNFTRLVHDPIAAAIELAAHLVENRLKRLPGTRLDRIMLSGRTSLMPIVAETAAKRFSDQRGGTRLPAGAPVVEVERTYAKQAASLGACWAKSIREFNPPRADAPEVREGRTVVDISVDNLFTALPANFYLNVGGADASLLLEIGEPFVELGPTGRLGIRTRTWRPMPETFELQREFGPRVRMPWAYYTFLEHFEEGFDCDPAVWLRRYNAEPSMRVLLELDQHCVPKLHLCNNGRPHFVAQGPAKRLRELMSGCFDDRTGRLDVLPKLAVRVLGATRDPVVLHKGGELTEEDLIEAFPLQAHHDDVPDSLALPTMSGLLPDVSGANCAYSFVAIAPGGREVELGEFPVTAVSGSPSFRFSLSVAGDLRVHRGELPYLSAGSLAEVQRGAGTVFSVDMDEHPPSAKQSWFPFTGKH